MIIIIIYYYHNQWRNNIFILNYEKLKMYPKVNILYPKRIQMYPKMDTFYIFYFITINGNLYMRLLKYYGNNGNKKVIFL